MLDGHGLALAGFTQDHGNLALWYVQIQIIEDTKGAKYLCDFVEMNHALPTQCDLQIGDNKIDSQDNHQGGHD